MTEILVKGYGHPARDGRLREFLDTRSGRQFAMQVEMSDRMSRLVAEVARRHRMRNPEVLDAVLCALVSAVQAMAPEQEWGDIGQILAEVLIRRLTVVRN
ncbi:MAG: hypothetical protein KGL39_24115 [Patescibacteria group bacterium]|nr:hypothetical protein [Patescibacteria group bacterium]